MAHKIAGRDGNVVYLAGTLIPPPGSVFYPMMALGLLNPFTALPTLIFWGALLGIDDVMTRRR